MSADLEQFARRGMAAQAAVDWQTIAALFRVLAIDPGTRESAYVGIGAMVTSGVDVMHARPILVHDKIKNEELLSRLNPNDLLRGWDAVVIEMISSYGMAVGAEVFETIFWTGRFFDRIYMNGVKVDRVFRQDVKTHMCASTRATDANIRSVLMNRYGPGKDIAVGLKAKPGPLYGIKIDEWQALAVGLTWLETR